MANLKKYNGNNSGHKSNTGLWLALAALAAGTGLFFYFKNKDKREAKRTDEASEDISNFETAQALELKGVLGASKTFGTWTTNGEIVTYSTAAHVKILNIMLAVVDWKELQKKFRELCDGEFTLTDALNKALSDNDYKKAIEYARAKKVVTTAEIKINDKTQPENTILGVLKGEEGDRYLVINEIKTTWGGLGDDGEVVIKIPQMVARLQNPVS